MKIIKKINQLRILIYKQEQKDQIHRKIEKNFPNVRFSKDVYVDDACSFEGSVNLAENVKLHNCHISENTYIAANSKLKNCHIGKYCSIGPELLAGLGKHPTKKYVSTHPSFYAPDNVSPISFVENKRYSEFETIKIGSDVWIGARVTIVDGVKIGDGAIIGAGAVVTKDISPYSIVAGVPAKEIGRRFSDDQIQFLLDLRWWDKSVEWIRSKAHLFDDIQKLMDDLV